MATFATLTVLLGMMLGFLAMEVRWIRRQNRREDIRDQQHQNLLAAGEKRLQALDKLIETMRRERAE